MGETPIPFAARALLSTLSTLSYAHINLRALVKVARTSQSRLSRMVN